MRKLAIVLFMGTFMLTGNWKDAVIYDDGKLAFFCISEDVYYLEWLKHPE